jgi:hypothetical protein
MHSPTIELSLSEELRSNVRRVASEYERVAAHASAALQGHVLSPHALESMLDQVEFLGIVDDYCVGPLLRRSLKQSGAWSYIPSAVRMSLDARTRREMAFETLRFRETRRVLAALGESGVDALVLKGTALAYTHYAKAYLRPRADTDLFIRERDRSFVTKVLEGLGYQRANSVSRDAVHTQWMFKRKEGPLVHVIDLHWAISNPQLFRGMLSFDELFAEATPVAPLGPCARGPATVHALLLACIHRVAHHDDSPNPLWLYDIKLLAEGLSPSEWDRFWELAARKQIGRLCADGLAQAARHVGCSVPRAALELPQTVATCEAEASAAYLGGVGTGLRGLLLDLKNAVDMEAKFRLLAGHAFPAPNYMRRVYGTTGRISLAAAYVRRATRGIVRLIVSSDATSTTRVG